MSHAPTRQEVRELADYLEKVVERIPRGLSHLKDALTFALIDLDCYAIGLYRTSTYRQALDFAQSIPRVEDLEGDTFTTWMLNDLEHRKYLP